MSSIDSGGAGMSIRDAGPEWPMRKDTLRTNLLSVEVVLALLDPGHALHEAAHHWFERSGCRAWATCPLIENRVIRSASRPTYGNSPGTSERVCGLLDGLCRLPGHHFWTDSISMRDSNVFDIARPMISGQVSDIYLLGLAVANGGGLATFDRKLDVDCVIGGRVAVTFVT